MTREPLQEKNKAEIASPPSLKQWGQQEGSVTATHVLHPTRDFLGMPGGGKTARDRFLGKRCGKRCGTCGGVSSEAGPIIEDPWHWLWIQMPVPSAPRTDRCSASWFPCRVPANVRMLIHPGRQPWPSPRHRPWQPGAFSSATPALGKWKEESQFVNKRNLNTSQQS